MFDIPDAFWSTDTAKLESELGASPRGLTTQEAGERLERFGHNTLKAKKDHSALGLLLTQFKSPIIIILIFAAVLSFFLDDKTDAVIILSIVAVSGLLGFWQERGAANAVEKLMDMVEAKGTALRDGRNKEIPLDEFVPGDVAVLSAGAGVPGDCVLLESNDLFVNEAALTGETYPVEKQPGVLAEDTALAKRKNVLFMGTHVISGQASALVVRTGLATEFGKVSGRLRVRPQETEFERGVRRFGYLLMEVTMVMMTAIFALNVLLAKPILDSFMFSLALAVGLTPQLLPAIISINLATGAKRMAEKQVIVRRLASIENFGSMNILCSDKTGTLTDGKVKIHGTFNTDGVEDPEVLEACLLNSSLQTGFASPIDEAVKEKSADADISAWTKLDEVPYDFIRKRLSVLAAKGDTHRLVSKGALHKVLEVCSTIRLPGGAVEPLEVHRAAIDERYQEYSRTGFRCLGVAVKDLPGVTDIHRDDEADMVFIGFLTLWDPPKEGVLQVIERLAGHGVDLKVITGDNKLIAENVAKQIGLVDAKILTGQEIHKLSKEAFRVRAAETQVFAEVEPNQKEDIIIALKKGGNVVGFMGDGINDASAIKASDVGLSVDGAVDVAKEAADIVLLEKDLGVLERGVLEGRKTFANTLKYVFMATSANFGNMFSMAGASLFLPFLPLLPMQVLLTNLLTDLPEMTIATDRVDDEMSGSPHRWDIRFIRNFMLVFGPLSSIFDYMTFGVLIFVLHAKPEMFRTGWFVESVVSAVLIVLVVRTRRTILQSRPSLMLFLASIAICIVTIYLPYSPVAPIFEFKPLPPSFLGALGGIVILYVLGAEIAKRWFYKRWG